MRTTAAKVLTEGRRGSFKQDGYPAHPEDGGPLLPTTDGGLVCSKCHRVWTSDSADALQLSHAREAHRRAGDEPIDVRRPQPKSPADLTAKERAALVSVKGGNGHRLAEGTAAPLVMLDLVTETKEIGRGKAGTPEMKVVARTLTDAGRVLADACAEAANPPATVSMFDLGAPDSAAVARIEDAKSAAKMRKAKR